MIVNCLKCKTIFQASQGMLCPDCQRQHDEARDQAIYEAVMSSPARQKEIPMWAWQSLDRQTRVSYSPYRVLDIAGYFVDVIAPDRYFGHWHIHKTEEEAGAVVAALYDEFVRLQEKKAGQYARSIEAAQTRGIATAG